MYLERSNFNPEPPEQGQGELVKSEKEIAWEQKLAEVEHTADRLDKGVDEKIKETVAAFLVHEFTTDASCEGHITKEGEEQHGLLYPWVDIYSPEPEGWSKAKGNKKEQLEQEWRITNFKQQRKMMGFLEEFYKGREIPFDARLTFSRMGIFGGFRIQSFGAEMTVILTPEEKKQKLALYQREMADFTNFLKSKYLSKE
ncbi:MAG: hypothetical protein PHH35_00260 [Candidatus Pacebacteria bacterium]|nr:hypothetical protein [Candidatus Paceibacterota bacterium]